MEDVKRVMEKGGMTAWVDYRLGRGPEAAGIVLTTFNISSRFLRGPEA